MWPSGTREVPRAREQAREARDPSEQCPVTAGARDRSCSCRLLMKRASERADWQENVRRLDTAVYTAISETPTPALDDAFRALSRAADHSKLSLASAGLLASAGGDRGRRAAVNGLVSVGLSATLVNVLLKPLGGRRRPDRSRLKVPFRRQVRMPLSRSFPSGHSASAFAFATGVGSAAPEAAIPLGVLAALVSYSRIHTGVHYPSDVIVGSLVGVAAARVAVAAMERCRESVSDD